MSLYEASCSRCSYQRRLHDILRSYKLCDDDHGITIRQTFAWCEACRHVVHAERLEDLSVLKSEFDHYTVQGEEFYSWMGLSRGSDWREERERHLNNLRRRIEWRESRANPPKCLECGSTNVLVFPETDDDNDECEQEPEINHPDCDGRLRVPCVGFALSRDWVFYTPDGDKIATYEAFPSKGLVKREHAEQAAPPDRGGE
jgi:hypothetical protein